MGRVANGVIDPLDVNDAKLCARFWIGVLQMPISTAVDPVAGIRLHAPQHFGAARD